MDSSSDMALQDKVNEIAKDVSEEDGAVSNESGCDKTCDANSCESDSDEEHDAQVHAQVIA